MNYPWQPNAVVQVVLAQLLGFVAVVVGAYQASEAVDIDGAVRWTVLATSGLILGGVASVAWITTTRAAVHLRRQECDAAAVAFAAAARDLHGATMAHETDGVGDVVFVPGTHRYHVSSCPMVAGRRAASASVTSAAARRLSACEVCRP